MNNPRTDLGFGLMRLPKKLLRTDVKEVSEMVDLYLNSGFNYFDTAYVYPGSEKAIRSALIERYPRESFKIASKLNASMAPNQKAAKAQFETSLDRLGIEYFDNYLLHALMSNNVNRYDKYGIWEYLNRKKEEGLIKNLGFSFHSDPELLDSLLTKHPEIDFVQLQINYADWENPKVQSRANYEVAQKHNKPVIVMEPVKGGKLASPPKAVKTLFDQYDPEASYASWALRFVSSLDGIYSTLSGMSNVEQMRDNLKTYVDFKPLDEKEYEIIREAQKILGFSNTIECTACGYCEVNCPKHIPIPDIIENLNKHLGSGRLEEARKGYKSVTQNVGKAGDCIQCKQCERSCPQHLPITQILEQSREILEE